MNTSTGTSTSTSTRTSRSTSAIAERADVRRAEMRRAHLEDDGGQRAASPLARDRNSLSLVAETGDGCRIYRHTNGQYAVCAPESDMPARTAATLPCAYATCQDMTRMTG
ncbi:MAG: hypothetical protein WBN89_09390 [Prochlorococcaceae cyanobacterium]